MVTNQNTEFLTPGQVAKLFNVRPRTVTRWADTGKLPYIRIPSGHRRYPKNAVMELLQAQLDAQRDSS